MKKQIIWSLLVALGLIACGGGGSTPDSSQYTADDSVNLLNPDRGLYDADYILEEHRNYDRFTDAYEKGYRLVYAPIYLGDYKSTTTLPADFLEIIQENLIQAKNSGLKLILRIKYRKDMSGDDPTKEIILGHLNQLTTLLQSYKSTISVIQAGLIGAWGEWHSFTGDFDDDNAEHVNNRKALVEKLVEIFPNKYIQIRTPEHKEELWGDYKEHGDTTTKGQITAEIAYSDDIRAKIGHHNDCVLASKTDMGTYETNHIEFWKSYVENDSKYSPVGGETCAIGDGEDASLSDCTNALAEFKKMGYSYLNEAYHPDVLEKWKTGGCYETIKTDLGYKLVAKSLSTTSSSQSLQVEFKLANEGFGAPYVPFDINFILYNSEHKYSYSVDIDSRTLAPNKTREISQSLSLASVESGSYCLDIQLGKAPYAIHLANKDIWNSSYSSNKLKCDIEVK